ncbi:hypothetical protein ACIHDR_33690 [Nocardia sp. NPDC052278]
MEVIAWIVVAALATAGWATALHCLPQQAETLSPVDCAMVGLTV